MAKAVMAKPKTETLIPCALCRKIIEKDIAEEIIHFVSNKREKEGMMKVIQEVANQSGIPIPFLIGTNQIRTYYYFCCEDHREQFKKLWEEAGYNVKWNKSKTNSP